MKNLTKAEYQELSLCTSFHDVIIRTTVNKLKKRLGEPCYINNTGNDKVNFEWVVETKSGILGRIYNYKEYRKIKVNEVIEWHIGGKNKVNDLEVLKGLKEIGL